MSTYGEFVPYPSSAPVATNKGVGPEPAFDPMVHLGYQSPAERLTMSQLGLGHVATPVSETTTPSSERTRTDPLICSVVLV